MSFPPVSPRWAITAAGVPAANITVPPSGQLDTGFTASEVPPSSYQNWYQLYMYLWQQLVEGVLPMSTLPVEQFCSPPTNSATLANFQATTPNITNHLAFDGVATLVASAGAGSTGSTSIMYSVDGGFNWTTQAVTGLTGGSYAVYWVPFVSLFVLLDSANAGKIYTSPTGVTWTAQTIGANVFTSLAWSGTTAVLAYTGGIYYSTVVTSTWTNVATAGTSFPQVAYGATAGAFCLINGTTTGNSLWTSPTGVTWTAQTAPVVFATATIVWADFGNSVYIPQNPSQNYLTSQFIVNNAAGNAKLYASPTGATGTWSTPLSLSFGAALPCFWTGSLCYVGGGSTTSSKNGLVFYTSSDGTNWTLHRLPVNSTPGSATGSQAWNGIALANGNLVTLQCNSLGSSTSTLVWVGHWLNKDNAGYN